MAFHEGTKSAKRGSFFIKKTVFVDVPLQKLDSNKYGKIGTTCLQISSPTGATPTPQGQPSDKAERQAGRFLDEF